MSEKSFEEKMETLKRITSMLENGELPLDEAMAKFEEGVKIGGECYRALEAAEKKVEQLIKENGEVVGRQKMVQD